MAWLKKILGGTFESNLERGDELLAEGHVGEAKLAFDKALARAKGQPGEAVDSVRRKARDCRLALARQRLEEADAEIADRRYGEAEELLSDAAQICDEPEILEEIQQRREKFSADDVREDEPGGHELSEDEILEIIAGTWVEGQRDEYASCFDFISEALLKAQDGEHEAAAKMLEEVVESNALPVAPRYLHLEIAKELAAAGDFQRAVERLDAFEAAVAELDVSEELRIGACHLRAVCLDAQDRHEEAKAEYIRATKIAPEQHRVFLTLGVYLKSRGEHDSALRALLRASTLMGQMQPDFTVIRELGMTYLALGRKEEAFGNLSAVIEHQASRGEHDRFDPESALVLAKLYEEKGQLDRAADLYRHLAVGYDTKNQFVYNYEAARLLKENKNAPELVERYVARALELSADEEQRATVLRLRGEAP